MPRRTPRLALPTAVLVLPIVLLVVLLPRPASAHMLTSSVSDIRIGADAITYRLYLDPYHLTNELSLDRDGDGTITTAEIGAGEGAIRGLVAEQVQVDDGARAVGGTIRSVEASRTVDLDEVLPADLTGVSFPDGFDWVVVDMAFDFGGPVEEYALTYGIASLSDDPDEHTGYALISSGDRVHRRLLTTETATLTSADVPPPARTTSTAPPTDMPVEVLVLALATVLTARRGAIARRAGALARAVARPLSPRVPALGHAVAGVVAVAVVASTAAVPAGMSPAGAQPAEAAGDVVAAPAQAGATAEDPGYSYAQHARDVLASPAGDAVPAASSEPYLYARNDRIQANVLPRAAQEGQVSGAGNNRPGAFQPGWPVDVTLLDEHRRETLDWTELVLRAGGPSDTPDWYHGADQLVLQAVRPEGDAIVATGASRANPQVATTVTYRMLPDVPVMKLTVDLVNTGTTAFTGAFEYLIDNDEAGAQTAVVPGLGTGPGYRTSGWAANYLYNGPLQPTDGIPSHAIAWLRDAPVAIEAPGYVMGAWFGVDVPAGGTDTVELYHVMGYASPGPDPTAAIAEEVAGLLEADPDLADVNVLNGRIADTETAEGVAGATVVARNIDAEEVARAATSPDGTYQLFLPDGTYTVTATRQGYDPVSGSVEVDDRQRTYQLDLEMAPVRAAAATGRPLSSGQAPAEAGPTGITLENRHLAMAIATDVEDPQLSPTTRGKPLDLAAVGQGDGIDWINLPYVSADKPSGDEPWGQNNVATDTVEVLEDADPDIAQVLATGESTAFPGLEVATTFTARTVGSYLEATTRFTNTTGKDLAVWIGDALDVEGGRQASYSPGNGGNTGPAIVESTTTEPWMAMFNASPISYGVVYGRDDLEVRTIGTSAYIVSAIPVTIPAGSTFELPRRIVAAPYGEDQAPWDVVAEAYRQYQAERSGLTLDLRFTGTDPGGGARVGDEVALVATIGNGATEARDVEVTAALPPTLHPRSGTSRTVSVPAGGTAEVVLDLTAVEGGNRDVVVTAAAPGAPAREGLARLFVDGPGWFDGDNHSHSLYSDGSGTIAQNFAAGRSAGLSFLTATDHNTVRQRDDVEREDRPSFVAMTGDEESCSYGHSLAYAIAAHTDCGVGPQSMLDGVRAQGGFLYIAHPYYPGLEWVDFDSTVGLTGIEVWNGFYPPRHAVNAQAFATWDRLNREGRHLLGLANSDAHNPSKVGSPRIRAALDGLDEEAVLQAMRTTGAYYGTDGPDLRLTATGVDGSVGMGGDLTGPGEVTLDVGAFADAPVRLLRVIKNGEVLADLPVDGSTSVSGRVTDTAAAGDFYRVEVETASGRFAFSNPIWVSG